MKSSLSQIKSSIESLSSRQVEEKIPGLEDKIDKIEISDKYIGKIMNKCEWNMQELCNSIKRTNL
jgi:hypothetical protein